MDNIDFLFIGGIIPKEIEAEILSKRKGSVQLAANNFQWSLIRGFDSNLTKPVTIMNTMFVGSFPRHYKDLLIRKRQFSHTLNAKDYNLGFINLTVLKQFLRPFGEKKFLQLWALKDRNNKKIAFIYSLDPRFVQIAKLLKKYNPDIYIYITVNDLPEYIMLGDTKNTLPVRAWKALSKLRVAHGQKYIDGYMIVAEQIAKHLGIKNKPYIVIEALADTDDLPTINLESENSIKRVVYTGGLNAKYGILNLVEAFMQIQSEDYRLIICGDGETKEKIKQAASIDSRIQFMGVLSPTEVRKIQLSATVLVNPRQNTGDFTKYSFPIKTIEYLLSGVPVISYRLSGIPHEYDDHLFFVEDDTVEALRDKIIEVCTMPEKERINIGNSNRQFVIQQKNHRIQTKRILDMILQNIDDCKK